MSKSLRADHAPQRAFAGLDLTRPRLMGVVNVTPDSFSDGGETETVDAAVARGLTMAAAGADIIDVGGESTRPGALPVEPASEAERVVPVIQALAAEGLLVSVDSRHATVMAEAIAGGARIVNDVTALTGDPDALDVVVGARASVVLMHMQGEPRTMQENPRYANPVHDVAAWLAARVAVCLDAGLDTSCIAVDPGIGFGKTVDHNVALLSAVASLRDLGAALLVGVSRKSFIAKLSRDAPVKERLGGSVAAALWAVANGADIVRVHDVAATAQAFAVWRAISGTVAT